jgi:molybdopterin/thiamine biosynthesis adenylyltransferase
MQAKRVGVVGLGALGAPVVLELAKNLTGELRILDGDHVDAGTIVRWPVGSRPSTTRRPTF